ncbi:MAG: hypothetical protein SPH59_00440 [Sutterella wadsworthensis]|nr:hypothetical protein [Sutterella wadsworthensis]
MNGIVLHGVVGEQDEADVVVGFAGRQLKLGESVHTIFAVLAPHREFDGVLAGVRSVTRVLQCLTEKIVIGCQVSVAALNAVAVVGDVSVSQNGRHEQTGQGEGRNFLLANHDCSLKKRGLSVYPWVDKHRQRLNVD